MKPSIRRAVWIAVVAGVVTIALVHPAHASTILYQQAAAFPNPSSFETSYGVPGQSYFLTYDNFVLGQNSLISDVTWQGSYWDFVTSSNNPATPNTTSFQIGFWSDAGGLPGVLLSSQTIPIASVSATLAGLSATNLNVFNYQVTLGSSFAAQAGTTYWLSIFSNSTSTVPLWGWRSGSGGDGLTYQYNYTTGLWGTDPRDRAFSLSGNVAPVPEPGSMILLLTGLGAALGWRRLRRSPQR